MRDEPERLERLQANAQLFLRLASAAGMTPGRADGTPVIPCIVG